MVTTGSDPGAADTGGAADDPERKLEADIVTTLRDLAERTAAIARIKSELLPRAADPSEQERLLREMDHLQVSLGLEGLDHPRAADPTE